MLQLIIDNESPIDNLPKGIPLGKIKTIVRGYEDMYDTKASVVVEEEENVEDWI